MNLLSPTKIRTDRYLITYYKPDNLLLADDSDLPRPSQVWDDAADVGYTVVSHRTEREVIYVEADCVQRKGDILYWDFKPANRKDHGLPILRVFND